MKFWKRLAILAGAAAVSPVTGGASLVAAIAVTSAIDMTSDAANKIIDQGKKNAREEGRKAGEATASAKYEKKVKDLADRLKNYHDFDSKVVGLYAIGLAIANADGVISEEEITEIDEFVAGCLSGKFPAQTKKVIKDLRETPPSFDKAVKFARDAGISKQDIQEVIEITVLADDEICEEEKVLMDKWERLAEEFAAA